MTNDLESSSSPESVSEPFAQPGWFKMGAVAAGSLLAGGLLAALWYRSTLKKLREADESGQNPHFGIPEHDSADEA
jgi:hypothetical protein